MILATCHDGSPAKDRDSAFLRDLDLTILAAPPDRYDQYAADIRREYAWVPDAEYRIGRRRVLGKFLDRPHIYAQEFWEGQEETARANLGREIATLAQEKTGSERTNG